MEKQNIEQLLSPPNPKSYKEYAEHVRNVVETVFGKRYLQTMQNFETFKLNGDHGARHSFNVYSKAAEIAESLEGESPDLKLIYLMATSHDSGRFHLSKNAKKQAKCERKHDYCGVAQIRLGKKRVGDLTTVGLTRTEYEKLTDYVKNHDYFNTRLDGDQYQEPSSLEGQIVRLADRMSTDISEEVDRYWETGKRLKTKYFISGVPFEDRINFSFRKVKDYIVAGKFDEFTFFLALLSMSETDFKDKRLGNIYSEWANSKHRAVERILNIAKEEGYSEIEVAEMRNLLNEYCAHFGISIGAN